MKLTSTDAPILPVTADDTVLHAESVVACPHSVTMPADLPNSGQHAVITIPMIWVPRDLLEWLREDLSALLTEWDHKKTSRYRDEAQEYKELQRRFEQVDRLLGGG